MSESRILIIEADPRTRRIIHTALLSEGYDVLEARSSRAGLKLIGCQEFDLAILGEDQRGKEHVEMCRPIREHDPKMAILTMMTRRGRAVIEAFEAGADGVIRKPVNIAETLARVRAVLRRARDNRKPGDQRLKLGDVEIDFQSRVVSGPNEQFALAPKEFQLLSYLVANPNKTISHQELLKVVWGSRKKIHSLRVMIERLRRKIERAPKEPQYLLTVPWVGYLLQLPT